MFPLQQDLETKAKQEVILVFVLQSLFIKQKRKKENLLSFKPALFGCVVA